ncbi:phosphate ABC transporter substrate-binding protein [Vibrio hangzhouensis]|uniref:phosphate ABC transporter substrate-binding protein n=1 Tax=Vibrio hangzhouensis TaxID=462991 RepID=UPI001C9874AB|nr:phosphate ABC transporter substrate-binding protein [Vibrio hangzhouensis]MBY6198120.1 phosphate ABC transporter substrate-binding protein [Vibrio hangzhouensis]
MLRVALAALLSLSPFIAAQAEEVNISGSTSVARVMDVLAEHYNASHKNTFIAVQGVGSTAGITLVKKGVADIGMSSRYLTEEESSEAMDVFPIAYDGLAIVVNLTNPVQNLTRQQLFDIYKGNITNWKQVGGPDQEIAVVTREASSGTRYSFETLLGLTQVINDRLVSDINPTNLVVNSNSMVKTIVNHNPHAVGFISEGSVDLSVKAIQFEGVEANRQNISDGKYKLARPFLLLHTKDDIDDDADKFIRFVLSKEGQALIQEYGYTPIKK